MRTLIILAAAALAACATTQTPAAPSYAITPGQLAPPQAALYADCIAQSANDHSYDREDGLIRFHCSGAPAQAFYDGLAAFSARIGSEQHAEGRTWRFTQVMTDNPFGLDFCTRTDADGAYACTIVLNAGSFVSQ